MNLTIGDLERLIKRNINKVGRDAPVTIAIGESELEAARADIVGGSLQIEVDDAV